ncbi:hypothetical protein D3C76_1534310 [compost metagenome]
MMQAVFTGAADADKRTGDLLQIGGKILAPHMQGGGLGLIAFCLGNFGRKGCPFFVVDQHGRPGKPRHLNLCTEGGSQPGCDLADMPFNLAPYIGRVRAYRTL